MKNVLEIITDNKIGYKFQCDDRKRQDLKVPTDDYFKLSETDKLNDLLNICNEHHLNYNLIIEEWSEKEQEITNEIYIVANNCENI